MPSTTASAVRTLSVPVSQLAVRGEDQLLKRADDTNVFRLGMSQIDFSEWEIGQPLSGYLLLTTPEDAYVHLAYRGETWNGVLTELYEGGVKDVADTGAYEVVPLYDVNRNMDDAPTNPITFNGVTPGMTVEYLWLPPSVEGATLLARWEGRCFGSADRAHELILKPDTVYCLYYTGQIHGDMQFSVFEWWEEAIA